MYPLDLFSKQAILNIVIVKLGAFWQIVAPKRKSLAQAEEVYATTMVKLRSTWAELKTITDKLDRLNDELRVKQREKQVGGHFYIIFMRSSCDSGPHVWIMVPHKLPQ